jgi:Dna[CI] antecedent, DciA
MGRGWIRTKKYVFKSNFRIVAREGNFYNAAMNPPESHRENNPSVSPLGSLGAVKSDSGGSGLPVPVRSRPVGTKGKRISTSGFISSRIQATRVRSIGNLVSQLISRRGYASAMSDDLLAQSVREAVPMELAASFRIGKLRGGVLQIFVTDSATLQEFNFQKRQIIKRLAKDNPDKVKDLRFKISD